jgi:MFS family permease
LVGNLSDRIGRRPLNVVGALGSGLLSFGYLYAISLANVPRAIVISLLMWGLVYQGYNAIFPSFSPELFPARMRVSAMAMAQNLGTMITALLPAAFTAAAPPGSNVPLIVGSTTTAVAVVVAVAAWSARETFRIRVEDLGDRQAVPMERSEYERRRAGRMRPAT